MFRTARSALEVLTVVGTLALSAAAPARAQENGQGPPGSGEPERPPASAELLPSRRADPALARQLALARDYLDARSWPEATRILQTLLDRPEDALVSVKRAGRDGREVVCWTGLRAEATRLLGALPPAGREFYELRYGPPAQALLVEARETGEVRRVAEVARRYPATRAGVDALALLGAYHLDRGHPTLAALCFERLLDGAGGDGPAPATLFHAALAFRRAGDAARARQAWERVAALAPGGLRLGAGTVPLAALKKEFERVEVAGPAPDPEGVASLEGRWTRPLVREDAARSWLQSAAQRLDARGLPVLPAAVPVVAGGRVIYRGHGGVSAVDPRTGKEVWESPSAWSLDGMLSEPRHGSYLEGWVIAYLDVSPHVLLENAVLGTLGTDGVRVYAVDDLAVPPYRSIQRLGGRWQHQEPAWPDFGSELNEAATHSRLLALDAASGKVVWEAGGRSGDPEAADLADSYFLGPPLPLDGHLYVLTEKNNELALDCLRSADGALLWKQALAAAPTRLLLDPGRRVQAARPAYGDGILVCPTNAGLVAGVDVHTTGLAWAYPYRTEALTQSPPSEFRRGRPSPTRVVAEWKAPAAVVERGRVVFTAPDEGSIHCLSVRDGALLWKVEREEDDLYVAGVVAGKVLVVGRQAVRALDVADGKQVWQAETGTPSGRGVAGGNVYYLPLKEAIREKEPAVYAIDAGSGEVLARTPAPKKEVPGNLFLGQGEVLSQTATAVTAYPGRKVEGR